MSTWNNKPTKSFGNLKEIKNALYSFFFITCVSVKSQHIYHWHSVTESHLIPSREFQRDGNWWCLHKYTNSPTNNTAPLHIHTHTEANFAFHGIHNHNANQIPPATFSPLHTKFPAIKISRKRTMFYFLVHVVLPPGSLIHPHTLIWEKPTYGLLNPV